MFIPIVLLLLGVSVAEIYVLIQVGQAIGALPTVALLVLDSILGSALLRAQSRAVWRRFNTALAERRAPAREVADGALVMMGGALLISPGFVTDIAGVLMLVPPTRAVIRRALVRRLTRGVAGRDRAARGGRGAGTRHAYDVEGTAVDVDPRPAPRLP